MKHTIHSSEMLSLLKTDSHLSNDYSFNFDPRESFDLLIWQKFKQYSYFESNQDFFLISLWIPW